jgi:hypothetical protein
LKKWSPTNRSARFVAPAISAIVRLEVFDAKIVPGCRAVEFLKSAFERQVFGDRFDHDIDGLGSGTGS